jgi:hypothetical protein
VIERQRTSGQSIIRFCAEEGLAPASFHAWKPRLCQPGHEDGRTTAEKALVPVRIVADPGDDGILLRSIEPTDPLQRPNDI